MTFIRIVAAGVVALAFTAPAAAQAVSIVTTPAGSYTHSAGAAMAKVITETGKVRAILQAQSQQGMLPVAGEAAEFGMSNSFDLTFYVTGTGDYEGQGLKSNLRLAASLLPYRVAFHVRADSDIKTIADLKGKRVAGGYNAQKTIARITEAHLANAGLSYKDVQEVLTPNVSRAAEDFAGGKTDMLFFALGSAAVKQAAAALGGVRVLPIDPSSDAVKRMQAVLPGSYVVDIEPAAGLDGISAPTKLVAFDMILCTNTTVKDETVYQVVKALHQNKPALTASFAAFGLFNPDHMATPVAGVEFHPGAARYYREAGLLPKP